MAGRDELGLARSLGSQTMLDIRKDVIFLKMVDDIAVHMCFSTLQQTDVKETGL